MGMSDKPEYYTDIENYQEGTQLIIDYWMTRWLKSRLNFEPIYQRISNFDKQSFLVGNQVNDDEEWKFEKLKEVPQLSLIHI